MMGLSETAQLIQLLTGWYTPQTDDRPSKNKGRGLGDQAALTAALGPKSNTSSAGTQKPGQLNPAFVSWLMGYPAEWLNCADWATLSSRKSRRSLSALS
jgi:hypothetical protein